MIRKFIYMSILCISMLSAATVDTNKEVYSTNETITVSFTELEGQANEWIAVYPGGSTNNFDNIVSWKLAGSVAQGNLIFDALNIGDYDIRIFEGGNLLVAKAIEVQENTPDATTVETTKNNYRIDEAIVAVFDNMSGNQRDWIGIYPANSNNDWANMIQWKWIRGDIAGETNFEPLVAGDYEVRVFFNNSFNTEKNYAFTVRDNNPAPARILYDDFEDGIDPRWVRHSGRAMTLLNVGAVDQAVADRERQVQVNGQHSLRTYLGGGYYFPFQQPDVRLKFLEIDMKIGVSSHRFNFGVRVRTKLGDRRIEFSSWLNHTLPNAQQIIRGPYGNILDGHTQAYIVNSIHLHPAPSDFFVGTSAIGGGANMFVHYKIDIEEKLKLLEPNNELLEILVFSVNGGDYDNLALSSE